MVQPVAAGKTWRQAPSVGSRTFSETGKTVRGRFLNYWNTHGGLMQQGYPISEEFTEVSDLDGKSYKVQYFERAVFEAHPENQTPNDVLLSLLGVFQYKQKYPHDAPDQVASTEANVRLFTPTGKHLGWVFLNYWNTHGGLMQQGYPISEEFTEVSDLDGKSYKVQYFERAVFEYHPEKSPLYKVLLSQLGALRFRSKYTATPQAIKVSLNGVYMVSPNEGWAVGDIGTIAHYSGGRWQAIASPVGTDLIRNLNSIYIVSPTEGWAVGNFSTIVHYTGGIWQDASSSPGEHLNDVKMVSPDEGWAVGGGQGLGTILHYFSGKWELGNAPLPHIVLSSLYLVSPNEGWAVGDKILHLQNSRWSEETKPTLSLLRSVYMVSPNEGWAVGDNAILHYAGGSWNLVPSPKEQILTCVYMLSASDGWAVGTGGIIHYNGQQWEQVISPSQAALHSVYMISPTEGWAVGASGTILHYHDGRWFGY